MATVPVGFDGVLQWSATLNADPSAAAGLATLSGCRDVNATISVNAAEVTDRDSRFKRYCPNMIDVEASATVTYNASTNDFVQKCIDRDVMTIAVLHSSGGEGLYFTGQCFSADFAQPLEDGMTLNLTFAPVYDSVGGAPTWS